MKSNSGYEPSSLFIARSNQRFSPAIILFSLLLLLLSMPAFAGSPITGIARLSAFDRLERHQILAFIRDCSSVGLRREAAEFLEKRIHLGEIAPEEAAPLFEEILAGEGRQADPEILLPICETALRAGVRSPMILYAYGTALRLAGRLSDGSAALAQVEPQSPLYPYAIYGIGQIAAERGDAKEALEVFLRVRDAIKNFPGEDFLAGRAMRSQAELLFAAGRFAESAPLFKALLEKGEDPYIRIGFSLAGTDNGSEAAPPPEAVAGLTPKQRILYFLLQEGLSRERGEYEKAVAYIDRASEEFATLVSSTFQSPSESLERSGTEEFLYRQIESHRSLRQSLLVRASGEDLTAARAGIVELMAQLLFLDHSIVRVKGAIPSARSIPEISGVSPGEIDEIILRIERAALDGVNVDRLVEDQAKKLELLQNLAHPIQRYRLLARLEKGQEEIHEIKERIRQRREPITLAEEDGYTSTPRLFTHLGRFLKELEALREAAEEIREINRKHFNILREKEEEKDARSETISRLVREALAFDNDRFVILLPAVRALEDRARVLSRERVKREILDLHPVILLRLVDSLVAQANYLAEKQPAGWSPACWAALERAVSFLGDDRLSKRDRIECAIRIGSVMTGGNLRWEMFPGKPAGEKEIRLSAVLLPVLAEGAGSGERQEESQYMLTLIRMFLKDKDGLNSARRFLEKYPSSPFAGGIAVRLGNASLLEGKEAEAMALYRRAAGGTNPDAAGVARYMLGWDRIRKGDTEGAIRELSIPLSDPAFSCVDPVSFEQSVLSLAVRAWQEMPSDRVVSYPPVRDGRCGGKLLLIALGEAEEGRGETVRAAKVFDALSNRFASDRSAVRYETRVVKDLFRAGKDEEALSRGIRLKQKYGLGPPAESPSLPERETARQELVEMLASLAERKFEEGIRSGNSPALTLSAAAFEQLSDLRETGSSDKDAELLLKRSIALIRSGNREEGIPLVMELLEEQRTDTIGEQAAILYAETMIGAYERKEGTAENAEESAFLLLEGFPSEKAAALDYRAAAAFLRFEEYDRAVRLAETVEKDRATPNPLVFRARLIQAEAFLFTDNLVAARGKADSILVDPSKEVEPQVRERAKDIFLLSSLKEAETSTAGEDWKRASAQWEELGKRFPDAPEAPMYAMRAFRSYRLEGDMEGVTRVGYLFLQKFPRREETVEVAGAIGSYLEEQKEYLKAAGVYASVAESFPRNERSPRFLFLAARLSNDHGDPETARKRFGAYRAKYFNPRWMTAYATLAEGLLEWKSGKTKEAIREMEEGLQRMEAGVEPEAPEDLNELTGKARIAIGEYWSDQFRKWRLVAPLEKSLAVKDRFFRRALAAFEKTEGEAPLELAVTASLLSGDLLVEFGKSILSSQVPKGMKSAEREKYEEALRMRAQTLFERAMDRYSGALDRLEEEEGPSDLAEPILERLEETQRLLPGPPEEGESK